MSQIPNEINELWKKKEDLQQDYLTTYDNLHKNSRYRDLIKKIQLIPIASTSIYGGVRLIQILTTGDSSWTPLDTYILIPSAISLGPLVFVERYLNYIVRKERKTLKNIEDTTQKINSQLKIEYAKRDRPS